MSKPRTRELPPAWSVSRHSSLATRHFFFVLAGILLTWCPYASALDPALDVSQYAHTAWRVRDGFFKAGINSIAQTPDGYLWLGSQFGLLRFDGVKSVPWQPPPGQHLPANRIFSLLATRDGTLWVGTANGLASWKDGKLTVYPQLAGQYVFKLLEDHDGTVWVGEGAERGGRLCAIRGGTVQCDGADGRFGMGVFGLYEDSKRNLWVGDTHGLWQWKPGPPKFYALASLGGTIQALGEDVHDALLVGCHGGIYRFVEGKTEPYPLRSFVGKSLVRRMLRDRDGGLWIGTFERGIVHVHEGRIDTFSALDGLSGDEVEALFEDREGSIWVATANGLDRFRGFAIATFSARQGLTNSFVGSVLADRDGGVWLGSAGGLNRWKSGRIATFGGRGGKLNGLAPDSLSQDDQGRIWVSTGRELGYLGNKGFIPVKGVPGLTILSMAQDHLGNLWVASEPHGLFQLRQRRVVHQIPWSQMGRKDHASVLAVDPTRGGLWLGFFAGGIAYFNDGQVRASYGAADGLGEGRVGRFRFDPDSTVWVATAGGLSRLKNGRVATLTSKNGLPCDTIHWVIQDNDHSFWLYTSCGLVRIERAELDTWAAAVDRDKDAKRMIRATVFDSSDGVRSLVDGSHYSPQVARTLDGRIWFLPWDGVSVIDPHHLPFNKLPPQVHIEQVTADHKVYDVASESSGRLRLPPLVRDLAIDYTALSLAVPEKVHFRFKLEGQDADWREVVNERHVQYSNLSPRNYRFRVMACNNSGVWNEEGAFLDFSIAPAYYQTTWFRLSCVAALLALLWAAYQLRLRQVAQEFNMRLDERVNERTRIARELHDTLLQSFQGLLMRFQAVSNELDEGEPEQ